MAPDLASEVSNKQDKNEDDDKELVNLVKVQSNFIVIQVKSINRQEEQAYLHLASYSDHRLRCKNWMLKMMVRRERKGRRLNDLINTKYKYFSISNYCL